MRQKELLFAKHRCLLCPSYVTNNLFCPFKRDRCPPPTTTMSTFIKSPLLQLYRNLLSMRRLSRHCRVAKKIRFSSAFDTLQPLLIRLQELFKISYQKRRIYIPNQVKRAIQNLTMRSIFQLMEGIGVIHFYEESLKKLVNSCNAVYGDIFSLIYGGMDGTRTRDPLRDRQVF